MFKLCHKKLTNNVVTVLLKITAIFPSGNEGN